MLVIDGLYSQPDVIISVRGSETLYVIIKCGSGHPVDAEQKLNVMFLP